MALGKNFHPCTPEYPFGPTILSVVNLQQQKLFWLLIVSCHALPAQAKYDGFYEIELIAFTQYQTDTESEQWPRVPANLPGPPSRGQRPIPAEASTATLAPHNLTGNQTETTDTPLAREQAGVMTASTEADLAEAVEFTELTAEQLQLGSLVTKLRRRRLAARTLLHTGWIQKIKLASASVPVLVQGGEPLFVTPEIPLFGQPSNPARMATITQLMGDSLLHQTAPDSSRYELQGTVAFYQTRYPRIEANLCLTLIPRQPSFMLAPTASSAAEQSHEQVCIREIRGLKFGELIYFDNPVLGLLAQIRAVEEPPEKPSATQSTTPGTAPVKPPTAE